MATPSVPKNQDRILKKCISLLSTVAGKAADDEVGASTINRARRKVWVMAGQPTTAATGQLPGNWVLDTTNDEVYRFISANTFVNMTADS